MARLVYSPWVTRSITVNGMGHKLPWSAGFQTYDHSGTRLGGPGSRPWRDPATRVAAFNAAIDTDSPDHGPGFSSGSIVPAGGGADYRLQDPASPVGFTTRTHTDRAFFGTYLDSYDVTAWQPNLGAGVNQWLTTLWSFRPNPVGGDVAPLSLAEWSALFGPDPLTGLRQFALRDCKLTLHVTFTVVPAIAGANTPSVQLRRDSVDTMFAGWLTPAQLAALTVAETANGLTLDLPTEIVAVYNRFGQVPIPDTVYFYELGSLFIQDAMVDRTPGAGLSDLAWRRHLDVPQWTVGFDPGYDGDPPEIEFTNQFGGFGASWVANVTTTWSATISVKQRIVRTVYGTPPLHQSGRLGVLDASPGAQSQLVTPQSSPVQSAML